MRIEVLQFDQEVFYLAPFLESSVEESEPPFRIVLRLEQSMSILLRSESTPIPFY